MTNPMHQLDPRYVNGFIGTFSGKKVVLETMTADDISIIDIAVGLANQCRYAGQVWPFYSVAEHSILVADMLLPEATAQQRLKALLHDAPEYLINDMIRPVKRKVSGYDELETMVMDAICEKFSLDYSEQDWKDIKRQDDLITICERRELMPLLDREAYGRGVPEEEIPKVQFRCLAPQHAAIAFIQTFCAKANVTLSQEDRKLYDYLLGWKQ